MPRFVILEHDHPYLHYDLMLEDGQRLLTWRLAVEPNLSQSADVQAEQLPDHRHAYLDYEGPVSRQRGYVRRKACGELEWLDRSSTQWHIRLRTAEQICDATWNCTSPQQIRFTAISPEREP